jgi:hypothetical protein
LKTSPTETYNSLSPVYIMGPGTLIAIVVTGGGWEREGVVERKEENG